MLSAAVGNKRLRRAKKTPAASRPDLGKKKQKKLPQIFLGVKKTQIVFLPLFGQKKH